MSAFKISHGNSSLRDTSQTQSAPDYLMGNMSKNISKMHSLVRIVENLKALYTKPQAMTITKAGANP